MNTYSFCGVKIDSIILKCLVVSRGVKVDGDVYKNFSGTTRLSKNPLTCNAFKLSDNVTVQLVDMGFHLEYLSGILSFSNLKLLKYARELKTNFAIKMLENKAALFYGKDFLDFIEFFPQNNFYAQKTSNGTRFIGNAVLQGCDFVAFQCLWHCEFAASGKPCQFCFAGGDFENAAKKNKLPKCLNYSDAAEIVEYAFKVGNCNSIQITGGSTFNGETEYNHIVNYLNAIKTKVDNYKDLLLYITPPKDFSRLDEYFELGATKIACSLELWDEKLAKIVTPGKVLFSKREQHLKALSYIAEKHGDSKAFSNFIIGIEPFESLKEGATYLAERGIVPTASIWMPMGRPVNNSMTPPSIDYYEKVKDLFLELYAKYHLKLTDNCGLNVCIEYDLNRLLKGIE